MSEDEEYDGYEDEDEEMERDLHLFDIIDKSPEEAIKLARKSIISGWYSDWFEYEDDTPWTSVKGLIATLMEEAEHGIDNKDLLDRLKWYADEHYFSGAHLEHLWSKLTEEQKEAFLKDLYHDLAKEGLTEFLRTAGKRKLSLKEINDYLNGKISFRDLMNKLAKKYNVHKYKPEVAEDFWNAVDLAAYLSDEELKEIVKDYVLSAKLEELKERKQK